ncbi:hypothetical protein BDV96DRAFT_501171 [Lophiotrema nucula]|uniref:Membrane-associated, eicosanoid/glutathione metabolism protein n=1 Tax=Lophiotrema nucula TaxID=690887 RepID=A0A6A5YTZ1_9PLEO|nr:hypothetical protein BDV96DRAFT_501171 [Lophiotrema nucula]
MTGNYSLYAIPLYWTLAMYPHAYASGLIKKANNNRYDNANPKSVSTAEQYRKSVPSDCFARYERGEAAHRNMLENAPLFIGAVIVANMARLDASKYGADLTPAGTLNLAIGSYIGLRTLYIWQYINVQRQRYSYLRSVNWAVSTGILFWIFVKAGNVLF